MVWERMCGVAFGICCDRELATEASQEASVRVLGHIGQVREARAFVAWADRVTTRASLDVLRWYRARPVPVEPNTLATEVAVGDSAGEGREEAMVVAAALGELPAFQRAVVVLFYWLDRPLEEIADVLGCEVGTVKSRLARARAHLAGVLQEDMLNG